MPIDTEIIDASDESEVVETESDENQITEEDDSQRHSIVDLIKLPLLEKIKKLIAEFPLLSIWQIRKLLKDERFGPVHINVFKLYKLLRDNDMETKSKRYRYYRSC